MKHLKTFNLFESNQGIGRFVILPDGNLEISLDGSEDRENMENFDSGDDEAFLWEFFESELTNGFTIVPANAKGLTEAPMISDELIDDETSEEDFDNANVWYYNDYMISSVKDVLLKDGKVIFTKHNK